MKITHEVHAEDSLDAFTNSRLALKTLLEKDGRQIIDLKRDLELQNFQNLLHFPEYVVSVSHTKGAGAAIMARKEDARSLGIDIEWVTRNLKPEAQKFFRNPKDSPCEDLLKLWTMKEAAYKALSPLGFPGVLVLSKIIIEEDVFYTEENSSLKGQLEHFIIEINNKKLYLSKAIVST